MLRAQNFDLGRFVDAQAAVYETALGELRAGRKRSHWMWFIFPQMRGLGSSPTAAHYGIESLAEAESYLAHTVLGPRLVDCTEAVLANEGATLHAIFGSPDDVKFVSSMTLFARAAHDDETVFRRALDRFIGGVEDPRTREILDRAS